MAGCMSNNYFLELIVKKDKDAGALLTLAHFVGITLFAGVGRFVPPLLAGKPLPKRVMPLSYYATLTAVFATVQLLNNAAFSFDISQPLHMCIRSGSLVASATLGAAVFGRRYSSLQWLSVIWISVGTLIATGADAALGRGDGGVGCCHDDDLLTQAGHIVHFFRSGVSFSHGGVPTTQIFGIATLVLALVLSAALGQMQQQGYARYGRREEESLFYTHLLALPLFTLISPTLLTSYQHWLTLPGMPLLVTLNVITQYACLRGVYLLLASAGSLSATLALTVRKFASLLLSVLLFGNVWTIWGWIGTAMVFSGAIVYGVVSGWERERERDNSVGAAKRKTE
jgi:UDP-xylose/UDP-N-acetylglucosamine transporter B4